MLCPFKVTTDGNSRNLKLGDCDMYECMAFMSFIPDPECANDINNNCTTIHDCARLYNNIAVPPFYHKTRDKELAKKYDPKIF